MRPGRAGRVRGAFGASGARASGWGAGERVGRGRAGEMPGCGALVCRDSARSRGAASGRDTRARRARLPRLPRSRTLAAREARDPPGGPDAGLPGAAQQRRTGGRQGCAATARRDSARSRARAGGRRLSRRAVRARPSRTRPSRIRGPEPSSGRNARAGHAGLRVFRPLGRRDRLEARQPRAGPAAGLPSGRSNLHPPRAGGRAAAHVGVPWCSARSRADGARTRRRPGPGAPRAGPGAPALPIHRSRGVSVHGSRISVCLPRTTASSGSTVR